MTVAPVTEGTSDRMLLAPLRRLYQDLSAEPEPEIVRVPFERLPDAPDSLERRIRHVLGEGGRDLVLVHRDAGRRRRKFEVGVACHRIEKFVESWRALGWLPAFAELKGRPATALTDLARSGPDGDEREGPS